MGRRGGRGGRGGGRGGKRSQGGNKGEKVETVRTDYVHVPMENDTFERYYQAQGIIKEGEWELFMKTLRTDLPSSFRITGSKSNATNFREMMIKNYFPALDKIVIDGEEVPPPYPISWYPNQLAFQYEAPRTAVRRNPGISHFHQFLVGETEVGNISRQESVSMIPPLFLRVEPHHYVLDMCAAPGSKTAQLIEAIHANDDPLPTGLVIANDSDYKRSHMLVHQTKRLQSPSLIVTNHEAQFFPLIYYTQRGEANKPGETVLQFDRILCDVPCSGDGTLRKNRPIWKSWTPGNGNNLHRLQIAILLRACSLAKVGGRIVYSTCTFNPVENEAVIAEVLNSTKGAIKLLDVSTELPNLKRAPGVSSWKVMSNDGDIYSTYDEIPEVKRKKLSPSMFPPENIKDIGIEKCVRVLPYFQNTGGFFIAVFEKVETFGSLDLKNAAEGENGEGEGDVEMEQAVGEGEENGYGNGEEEKQDKGKGHNLRSKRTEREDDDAEEARETKKPRVTTPFETPSGKILVWEGKEEPFYFLSDKDKEVIALTEHYGINPNFPKSQYVVRSDIEAVKAIYFVSASVKKILMAPNVKRLRIVNTGVPLFIRAGGTDKKQHLFPYRISADGLPTLGSFLSSKRVVCVPPSDVLPLLNDQYPVMESFSEDTQKDVKGKEDGGIIFRVKPHSTFALSGSAEETIDIPVWKAPKSLSILVAKQDRASLLARLTGSYKTTKGEEGEKPADDAAADGEATATADE
ncbi:tRNA (cytosine(34)-C(5))-methyltransferase [Blyttiomyces sp. JEL0837]|nr:tRNA (cytosine(34)-C(5))-methyltransferase [Blyttiomyces sp. JEL0837]